MEILYLLIPIGLITLVVVISILFWAINNGQYDDLDTEAQRILFEEENVQPRGSISTCNRRSKSPSAIITKTTVDRSKNVD